ncbi:MAG: hypothetical protein IKO21_04275 [Fibrobacter sp.]|nr:hypothetical protein [Fibrobacter sp.]
MTKQSFHDVNVFINGIASVCKDSAIIEEKTLAHFGDEYKRIVRYILMMKFQKFSAKQFAEALVPRDYLDGLYDVERECAKRNGLTVVYGYSDDLMELDGAIRAEGNCFKGGAFHLKRDKGKWKLVDGIGKRNMTNGGDPYCEGFVFEVKDLKI